MYYTPQDPSVRSAQGRNDAITEASPSLCHPLAAEVWLFGSGWGPAFKEVRAALACALKGSFAPPFRDLRMVA